VTRSGLAQDTTARLLHAAHKPQAPTDSCDRPLVLGMYATWRARQRLPWQLLLPPEAQQPVSGLRAIKHRV
jgi:hypothetical protein